MFFQRTTWAQKPQKIMGSQNNAKFYGTYFSNLHISFFDHKQNQKDTENGATGENERTGRILEAND